MLRPCGVIAAPTAQGDAAVGTRGGRQVRGDRQAGEVAGKLGAGIGVEDEVAGGGDRRVDGDIAAIDGHRTGDRDRRTQRDGGGVGRLADGQTRQRRGIGITRYGGGEGVAGGFDQDRARPAETGGGRSDVATEHDAACGDGGRARVGAGTGERQGIGAELGQRAGAADGRGEGQVVGTAEGQRGVVDDRSADDARRAARADLQRAGADGRRARESVRAAEGESERAELRQAEAVASVGDHAG